MVGVEGKSNFSLSVTYNYLNNYKVLCAGGEEPKISLYPSAVSTPQGTIRYGGKLNQTSFDENMYLLKGEGDNLSWEKVKFIGEEKPVPRYGGILINYEDYLILFGGKNEKEEDMNDLWIFNLNTLNALYDKNKNLTPSWTHIDYPNTKNTPSKKFLPSAEIIADHGKILIYGGKSIIDDFNIYILDIKILLELLNYKLFYSYPKNKGKVYPKEADFDYSSIATHLWKVVEVKDILPRYGLTITHLRGNEVMFYGGMDKSDYPVNRLEILDLDNMTVKLIEASPTDFPVARGFHGMMKFGTILMLYGGKTSSGENLNDLWKFLINGKKWVKVNEPGTKDRDFYLYKSGFIFTKIKNSERPVIYGGENRNRESSNVLILMDFEICTSEVKILTDYGCIPCAEGYELTDQKKCKGCYPGNYLQIDKSFYTDSKCEKCPTGNFNSRYYQKDISSCKLCSYGEFNNHLGQRECQACPFGSLCLPGSTQPTHDTFLLNHVEENYQTDLNYPDYVDTTKIKKISRTTALIVIGAITSLMLVILLICYKVRKNKLTKFLIYMDFLPLTGGNTKKCSGGLITLFYTILILSLAFSFVMRYIYFNEVIEVIPIATSNTEQDRIKSTFLLNVDLVGSDFNCINKDEKLDFSDYRDYQANINDLPDQYRCHKDIEISKLNHKDFFQANIKTLSCAVTEEGHCRVTFKCEDCNSISNSDVIQISLTNSKAFIQLYRWTFRSFWAETFDESKGYSRIEGIFKADNNIKSNYVFKGDDPSTVQIIFTPIFYTNKNDNLRLSGYRASLNQYFRGSIRNDLNFYQSENGVKLNIQVGVIR